MKKLLSKAYRRLGRILRIPAEPPGQTNLPEMSLGNLGQFLYQKRLFEMVRKYDGDIVECGVGKGRTLLMWAVLCYEEAKHRHIWGFDSFEGFPEPTPEDTSPRNPKKGEWNLSTIQGINNLLITSGLATDWIRAHVALVKGFFEDSLPAYPGKQIALLHIDADLYQSYKTTLNLLYEKVVPGGIIAFDEYLGTFEYLHFPGAQKAINEFFSGRNVEILRDEAFGKYYVIKPK